MKKMSLFFVLLILNIGSLWSQSIYVSPLGNDKNPGTKEKPVLSFAGAQALVRKIIRSQEVEVIFANGIYYLPQTVKFTSDDNRKSVTWKAEEEGKAILSGGSLLDLKWKPAKNGIFVAEVTGVRTISLTKISINQLLPEVLPTQY